MRNIYTNSWLLFNFYLEVEKKIIKAKQLKLFKFFVFRNITKKVK